MATKTTKPPLLGPLEKHLLSLCAFTQRDVSEMHSTVQVLVTAGLIDEEQYSDAVNLVAGSRPLRNSVEERERLILVQFEKDYPR